MPLVPVAAAVEIARTALGHDVDESAAVAAILRLVVVQQHGYFADCVKVGGAAGVIGIAQIVAGDSVDIERVELILLPLNVRHRSS